MPHLYQRGSENKHNRLSCATTQQQQQQQPPEVFVSAPIRHNHGVTLSTDGNNLPSVSRNSAFAKSSSCGHPQPAGVRTANNPSIFLGPPAWDSFSDTRCLLYEPDYSTHQASQAGMGKPGPYLQCTVQAASFSPNCGPPQSFVTEPLQHSVVSPSVPKPIADNGVIGSQAERRGQPCRCLPQDHDLNWKTTQGSSASSHVTGGCSSSTDVFNEIDISQCNSVSIPDDSRSLFTKYVSRPIDNTAPQPKSNSLGVVHNGDPPDTSPSCCTPVTQCASSSAWHLSEISATTSAQSPPMISAPLEHHSCNNSAPLAESSITPPFVGGSQSLLRPFKRKEQCYHSATPASATWETRGGVTLVPVDWLKAHEQCDCGRYVHVFLETTSARGYRWPILVDSQSGVILDGHHRFQVAISLGLDRVPAVLVNYRKDNRIGVRSWSERTDSISQNPGILNESDKPDRPLKDMHRPNSRDEPVSISLGSGTTPSDGATAAQTYPPDTRSTSNRSGSTEPNQTQGVTITNISCKSHSNPRRYSRSDTDYASTNGASPCCASQKTRLSGSFLPSSFSFSEKLDQCCLQTSPGANSLRLLPSATHTSTGGSRPLKTTTIGGDLVLANNGLSSNAAQLESFVGGVSSCEQSNISAPFLFPSQSLRDSENCLPTQSCQKESVGSETHDEPSTPHTMTKTTGDLTSNRLSVNGNSTEEHAKHWDAELCMLREIALNWIRQAVYNKSPFFASSTAASLLEGVAAEKDYDPALFQLRTGKLWAQLSTAPCLEHGGPSCSFATATSPISILSADGLRGSPRGSASPHSQAWVRPICVSHPNAVSADPSQSSLSSSCSALVMTSSTSSSASAPSPPETSPLFLPSASARLHPLHRRPLHIDNQESVTAKQRVLPANCCTPSSNLQRATKPCSCHFSAPLDLSSDTGPTAPSLPSSVFEVTKDGVIAMGVSPLLFPPKTTKHFISPELYRGGDVFFSLDELRRL